MFDVVLSNYYLCQMDKEKRAYYESRREFAKKHYYNFVIQSETREHFDKTGLNTCKVFVSPKVYDEILELVTDYYPLKFHSRESWYYCEMKRDDNGLYLSGQIEIIKDENVNFIDIKS